MTIGRTAGRRSHLLDGSARPAPSTSPSPPARATPAVIPATPALAMALVVAMALLAGPAEALVATFDDLGLGSESYWNGSDLSGGYTSGGIHFENVYDTDFASWSGFAASTTTDSTTPGFGNQYSNITGGGAGGSAGFGVAFGTARLVLPAPQTVSGAAFTNTTYAALAMLDGDPFSKQFGGPSGDDPDFFRLNIEGIDALGASTGVVELMLADYRFADPSLDFVLDAWVFQDLSGLGLVKELRFELESSDVSVYGGVEYVNTPVYFAIDDVVTVPEPGVATLMGLGLALLAGRRRVRRQAGRAA